MIFLALEVRFLRLISSVVTWYNDDEYVRCVRLLDERQNCRPIICFFSNQIHRQIRYHHGRSSSTRYDFPGSCQNMVNKVLERLTVTVNVTVTVTGQQQHTRTRYLVPWTDEQQTKSSRSRAHNN